MIFKKSLPFSLCLISAAVMAQESENIEVIQVTSDFRGSSPQEISSSLSVIGEQVIQDRQAQHLEEILSFAPNVNLSSGASRGRFIQIRGIGERSQFSEPVNPSVGFVIDDMDFSGTTGVGTLFDVDQVEVLRGPQGTRFGASAMAGVVKIKTKDPQANANGHVRASFAEKDTTNLAAAYGDSINASWQYRVAIDQYKSDGYIDNVHLGRPTDNIDELSSRLKLRYLASDDLTVDFAYQYFDIDNGYDAFSLDNDSRTQSDEPGFDRQETKALSVSADWRLPNATVEIAANTSQSDIDYGYDEDWTFVGFHPNGYSSTDYYFRNRDIDSVDIRGLSNENSLLFNGSTSWVVGAYFKNVDEDLTRQYTFNSSDFTSDYQVDTFALYGELQTQLSQSWSVIWGLRVEDSSIDYRDNSGFGESFSDTLVGGKLVAEYQMDESRMVYAGINRGYKLGGFNPDQRITNEQRLFDPEYNWNYEAGIKQYLFDGDIYIGVSVFHMDRKNTQVSDFFAERDPQTNATTFVDIIDNADLGKNSGAELETRFRLSDGITIHANAGVLSASFEDYVNAQGETITRRDAAQAPDYTFNIGAIFQLSEGWRLAVDSEGKGGHFFSDGHDEKSKPYVLFNARASYSWDNWELSFWGTNLFDKEYYVRGFGGFSNDPRDVTPEAPFGYAFEEPYFQIADGRQLGVTLDFYY